ncbi:aldolase/citrate lyase family protein, partial [Aquabacterium sp.]|uniref:HpcH/HpaI aldolase family protein n=1 Tax=Aquabacterium sp. TaxID=1872578 RepID=UPI0019C0E54F
GIAPLVRVPANTPEWISRVLDGGAMGIIAPHVSSVDEARRVVAAARFAPLGGRSVASGMALLDYRNFPADEAALALNETTLVMVQFEDTAAIDQADAIMAVDGVDLCMVGFTDLTASMGIAGQYGHARVREAFAHTVAACRRHGKYAGIGGLASRPDLVAEFVAMGGRYVSTGTDLGFLLAAATGKAAQVHELNKLV